VNGVSTSHGFREETRDDEAAAPLASTASRPRAASASLTRASERACATGSPMSTKRSVCPRIDVMRRSGSLLGPLRSLPPSPRFRPGVERGQRFEQRLPRRRGAIADLIGLLEDAGLAKLLQAGV